MPQQSTGVSEHPLLGDFLLLEVEKTHVSQVLVEGRIYTEYFLSLFILVPELTGVDKNGLDASSILEIARLDLAQPLTH